jgi:hypothetical protein
MLSQLYYRIFGLESIKEQYNNDTDFKDMFLHCKLVGDTRGLDGGRPGNSVGGLGVLANGVLTRASGGTPRLGVSATSGGGRIPGRCGAGSLGGGGGGDVGRSRFDARALRRDLGHAGRPRCAGLWRQTGGGQCPRRSRTRQGRPWHGSPGRQWWHHRQATATSSTRAIVVTEAASTWARWALAATSALPVTWFHNDLASRLLPAT